MQKYIVQSAVHLLPNVLLLTLQPRAPHDRLRFYAGQYATIGFSMRGRKTPVRCFSIVSSPSKSDVLQFAMRIEGNFTSAAARLRPGDEVQVSGPFGEFVVDPRQDQRIAMFAGGIGITPFISMLRYATETQLPTPITLLYSCRSFAAVPFHEELARLAAQNANLRVILFVTDGETGASLSPHVQVVTGRIDDRWLDQVTRDTFRGSTYFICGPAGFSAAMQQGLRSRDIDEDVMLTESFTQAPTKLFDSRLSISKLTYGLTAAALIVGVFGITAMDLVRNLPRLTASQPTQQSQSTDTSTTSQNTSGDDASASPNANASASGTTNQGNATSTQVYQQPISRVS